MQKIIDFLDQEHIEYTPETAIRHYTTIKIGGHAGLVVIIHKNSQLEKLVPRLLEEGKPYILLGGGSNVIFTGESPGLVLLIDRTPDICFSDKDSIKVNGGVTNHNLLHWCSRNNAGGFDFLSGIPGTLGGATAVNAGAFQRSISDILEKAVIINRKGETEEVGNDYFQFQYRNSAFKKSNECILDIFLKYTPQDNDEIKRLVAAKLRYRKENHPSYHLQTAGCFFKNPQIGGRKVAAGKLIEDCGLKGYKNNRMTVSPQHANFLINEGGATFEDSMEFERQIYDRVLEKHGVSLEREVIYISPDGTKY
jgi:UDP-N-acetylmuramate dehydrogenase